MLRTLFITIVEAKDLRKADASGSVDPYVILQVGAATKSTTVKPNDISPYWDERFAFNVRNETMIQFEVRDENILGSGVLGNGILPISEPLLKELRRGGAKVTVPLQDKPRGRAAGHLYLIVQGDFGGGSPGAAVASPSPAGRASPYHSPRLPAYPAHTPSPGARRGGDGVAGDWEAAQLRAQMAHLQQEMHALKLRNQELETEHHAAVEPLRHELQHNKTLLVQAVQCIEELAEQQRKLEGGRSTPRRPSPAGRRHDDSGYPGRPGTLRSPLGGRKGRPKATTPRSTRGYSMEAGDAGKSPYGRFWDERGERDAPRPYAEPEAWPPPPGPTYSRPYGGRAECHWPAYAPRSPVQPPGGYSSAYLRPGGYYPQTMERRGYGGGYAHQGISPTYSAYSTGGLLHRSPTYVLDPRPSRYGYYD